MNYGLTGRKEQQHGRVDYGPIRNTSVTSLVLPSPEFKYGGDRPKSTGGMDRYQVKIEVMNGTEHLESEQLKFWSEFHLGGSESKL